MKNVIKSPTKQLEKFSTIFTQLGLVLVLFIVYVILEHETPERISAISNPESVEIVSISFDQPYEFTREPKPKQQIQLQPTNLFIPDEKINKGDNDIKETIIDLPEEDAPIQLDIDTVVTVDEPVDKEPEETVPFILIENAPVFKGCEGLSKQENKLCFDKKMKKFVQKYFDTDLASELGLHSGVHKIFTQFIIDENGKVTDIKVRAPHPKLKIETLSTIEKLPKFTPGKQNRNYVKVKYTLPITFRVD